MPTHSPSPTHAGTSEAVNLFGTRRCVGPSHPHSHKNQHWSKAGIVDFHFLGQSKAHAKRLGDDRLGTSLLFPQQRAHNENMTVRWDVALPPLVIGLLLGFVLLIYGLQKVLLARLQAPSAAVSRACKYSLARCPLQTSGLLTRGADLLGLRPVRAFAPKQSQKRAEDAPKKPTDVRILITPLKSLRSRDSRPRYSSFQTEDPDLHAGGGPPAHPAEPHLPQERLGSRRGTFDAPPIRTLGDALNTALAASPKDKLSTSRPSFTPRTNWTRGCDCTVRAKLLPADHKALACQT